MRIHNIEAIISNLFRSGRVNDLERDALIDLLEIARIKKSDRILNYMGLGFAAYIAAMLTWALFLREVF